MNPDLVISGSFGLRKPNNTLFMCILVTQSCPTICDPMDRNLPGYSVHGILQARVLEWVAIPFSKDLYPGTERRSPALQMEVPLFELPGKPILDSTLYQS